MGRNPLDAGAFVLSTTLFYPTAKHAPTSEVVAVGRSLTARKVLYVSQELARSRRSMRARSAPAQLSKSFQHAKKNQTNVR